jgi:AsmA-like C-terminal region
MVGVTILLIALSSVIPFSSETARAKVVELLAAQLDGEVQLDSLTLRVLPQLRAEGAGLTIRHKGRQDVPPLISIRSFAVEGSVFDVLRRHVSTVTLEGLQIQIPPRDRDNSDDDTPLKLKPAFIIDNLFTKDAQLLIIPRNQNKQPKKWAIHDLHMQSVSFDQAMPFEATLTNGVPPGEIATKGTFGPWHPGRPGNTPLDGMFTFDKADLSVFNGISGILSAKGTFGGKLERIEVHGDTTTPDFTLTDVGHAIPLRAKYDTIVDGTNGDTFLERIDASWRNTSLVAKGSVADAPGVHGRQVDLDVTMDRARIEDVLWLAVKTPTPPLSGALTLKTRMVIPPGKVDAIKKLLLDGTFALSKARFTNSDVQKKIEGLSQRSRGQVAAARAERVMSDFAGSFKLANGVLTIPTVAFGVPGSLVRLSGTYGLLTEAIDFKGTLFMDAKISETVGGFKRVLLKVVDPLFKGEKGGSAIPIRISGRRDKPTFGLDKGRIFKR